MKVCRWDSGISQENQIRIYKQMIRPVLEYGSVIWGEAAKSSREKLETIQHRSLCKSMGIMRFARKSEVNQESQTWPLELRRWQSLIRQWKKLVQSSDDLEWLKNIPKEDRLNNKRSTSFIDRVFNLSEFIGTSPVELSKMKDSEIDEMLNLIWKRAENAKSFTNKRRKLYHNINDQFSEKYIQWLPDRKKTSIWHQTRLGVLPLNSMLYRLKKVKTPYCNLCNRIETMQHFLSECNLKDKNGVNKSLFKKENLEKILKNKINNKGKGLFVDKILNGLKKRKSLNIWKDMKCKKMKTN